LKPTSTPWHKVVELREDLKTGELSLSLFAADLYDVVMGKARQVYQDPYDFFALTYPTYNLRELAKDVVLRLAGKNDKAIRQLELTYGGGKTHTLITLYHLTHDPRTLRSDLPAIQEFIQHIGQVPPRARTAVLAFDKLDAEKGMEVQSPDGEMIWLKHPWSVLAFQLAGRQGLRILNADNQELERDSAPAEPLLVSLLSIPVSQGLAPLILIDEVLMYVREKVGLDPTWHSKLINFFQYLTQAATKVRTCAIVASLLATDPLKSDPLGKELTRDLSAILRRETEESVQPVLKEDVAEVLRRRFFEPESIKDRSAFLKHVLPVVQGIAALDEQAKKDMKGAENRFLDSYPFHPDLTEILYTKWTQLQSFQRTRGILRTFALALRDAEKWDTCPLVGTNVFLGEPGKNTLSESARELTNVAEAEEYEGK
jgi:predicted AAA+ superfamily ATPase